MLKQFYFSIDLSYQEFLPYYQGQIHSIVATTKQGVRVQFPAVHLRKYVTSNGIQGYFCLNTENNKFLSLIKLA